MKILYIGHYREKSGGWRQAAFDYMRALDRAGVEVVTRPVIIKGDYTHLPDDIAQFEQRGLQGTTHCIQHVLPHHFDWSSAVDKNVGFAILETKGIYSPNWMSKFNLMDEIWCPNRQIMQCIKNNPKLVPHCTDITKYTKNYNRPEFLPKDRFIFYFIGEHIRRKNIEALLQAYNATFTNNDDVLLVIKSNQGQDTLEKLQQTNKVVGDKLRLYSNIKRYPDILFICDNLSEDVIYGIHQHSNCYVLPSYGEAWCMPAFDAYGFGNKVLYTQNTGPEIYLDDGTNVGVLSQETRCFGADEFVRRLHSGREIWRQISIQDLSQQMLKVVGTNKVVRDLKNYDYSTIGDLMVTRLEC